jgi:hypothetical protein
MVRGARFSLTRLRPGYEQADVRALPDEVERHAGGHRQESCRACDKPFFGDRQSRSPPASPAERSVLIAPGVLMYRERLGALEFHGVWFVAVPVIGDSLA